MLNYKRVNHDVTSRKNGFTSLTSQNGTWEWNHGYGPYVWKWEMGMAHLMAILIRTIAPAPAGILDDFGDMAIFRHISWLCIRVSRNKCVRKILRDRQPWWRWYGSLFTDQHQEGGCKFEVILHNLTHWLSWNSHPHESKKPWSKNIKDLCPQIEQDAWFYDVLSPKLSNRDAEVP